jgi:hypothetical protein
LPGNGDGGLAGSTLVNDFPTAAAVRYVASASRPPPWKSRTQAGRQISSEQLLQGMGHLQSAARARDQQDVPKEPNATAHPGA